MDAELKAKWVAALRSGRYQQTVAQLRATHPETKHCCLGVLCDISGDGVWSGSLYEIDTQDMEGVITLDGDLGRFGLNRFGISSAQQAELIGMNDDDRATFQQIADYIEAIL